MSGMAEIGISPLTLLRSLMVGTLAVATARALRGVLADARHSWRRAAWVMLLAPYFTPVLLTGYAYASFSLSLIHHPDLNAAFYTALLWWKFTPLAAVILHFTPVPVAAEAVHCHRLAQGNSRWSEWKFLLRAGCGAGPLAAFAIVFLCAFSEFEMASLMVIKSWTVTLFDAHAGGLALGESVKRTAGPLACEAAAIVAAFALLRRRRFTPPHPNMRETPHHRFAWLYLVMALAFVLLIPAGRILWGAFNGLALIWNNFVLGREILASLLFAAGASVLAGLAALYFPASRSAGGVAAKCGKVMFVTAALLGLLGPLVLSLVVLAAIQLPGLIAVRDTPLPLVFTLGLVLLPTALVLGCVLALTRQQAPLHLVNLMAPSSATRELAWRLSTSGKFWAVVLLFVWAYWDLTASAILAPIGMTPVTVRLYNLMHYGQIATLSAMTCVAMAAPVLAFLLAFGTRRWWPPR